MQAWKETLARMTLYRVMGCAVRWSAIVWLDFEHQKDPLAGGARQRVVVVLEVMKMAGQMREKQ